MHFCHFFFFFQNQLFPKIISGIPSECQTDWIPIRRVILSGLIWVQSVCKGYQQTTLVGNELTLFCLFALRFYIPVNYFSVMSGWFPVFLGLTSAKQQIKLLAQGHNTVPSAEAPTHNPSISSQSLYHWAIPLNPFNIISFGSIT